MVRETEQHARQCGVEGLFLPVKVGSRGSEPSHGKPRDLGWMFHELMSRDRDGGWATGQPQGVGSEAYLKGTSQGPTPEDARKDGQIRGRSKRFMKYPA
jgi:hypothetical protein